MLKDERKTKKIAIMGLLSALAYTSLLFIKIPIIPTATFLSYDVKDVIIMIGAFLFGPMSGFIMAIVVSFLQMLTVSSYGWIGFLMNVLSTTSFVCVAALVYKKKKNFKVVIIGVILACISMTTVMLLWNYLVTPLYMGVARETVRKMLLPVFLPFNLFKSILNAIISVVLYKGIIEKLYKLGIIYED